MTFETAALIVLAAAGALVLLWRAAADGRAELEREVLDSVAFRGSATSADLSEEFGPRVYGALRRLAARGVLLRTEGPGTPERGGRPVVTYRWTKP
jgi:chromosome segregation and condensation protein ScpB